MEVRKQKELICNLDLIRWGMFLPVLPAQWVMQRASRIYRFLSSSRIYRFFDPPVKLKPKGDRPDTIMGVFNTTLYRLMQTAAAKHVKLGLQCRLKSSHVGLAAACECEADRDIFPVDSLFCVWQHLLYSLASDATHYIKGSGGEQKERKIRVRIISTGKEKRE